MRLFQGSDRSTVSRPRRRAGVIAITAAIAVLPIFLASRTGTLSCVAIASGFLIALLTWWKWSLLSAITRATGCICAAVLLWTGTMTLTVLFQRCDNCHSTRMVFEVSCLGCVVGTGERRHYDSLTSRMASELGANCPHHFSAWPKRRYVGMVIPVELATVEQGDWLLSDGDRYEWYGESQRNQLQRLSAEDPGLANEFRDRVLLHHDYGFLSAIVEKIFPRRPEADGDEKDE